MSSKTLKISLPSGSQILGTQRAVTWAMAESGYQDPFFECADGYILKSDMIVLSEMEKLFEISDIQLRKGKVTIYDAMRTDAPHKTLKSTVSLQSPLAAYANGSPWIRVIGTQNENYYAGYAFIGSADVYREPTGDGKTYGIVVAAEIGNRVHLREKANKDSRSLGKYFSGTQLEIVQSANKTFWQVKVDGKTGYMMKDYVRVVNEKASEE